MGPRVAGRASGVSKLLQFETCDIGEGDDGALIFCRMINLRGKMKLLQRR